MSKSLPRRNLCNFGRNPRLQIKKWRIAWRFAFFFVLLQWKKVMTMEERKFKTRGEQMEYYANLRGWGPLTEEDEAALDDAVRMITHLD